MFTHVLPADLANVANSTSKKADDNGSKSGHNREVVNNLLYFCLIFFAEINLRKFVCTTHECEQKTPNVDDSTIQRVNIT